MSREMVTGCQTPAINFESTVNSLQSTGEESTLPLDSILWTLRSGLRRLRFDTRGQSMVEMALVIPIFVLLLMGIIDFGRIYNANIALTHASREGARYAATGKSDAEVVALIKDASPTLQPGLYTIVVSPASAQRRTGEAITVSVNYKLELLTPIVGRFFDGGFITLKTDTAMRLE